MSKWHKIPGFDNYRITRSGKVKSLARYGTSGGVMKPYIDRNGYKRLHLRCEGGSKHVRLHRLLALAFIDNPKGRKYVNHKDGDKLNNELSNLEWCTFEENMKHAHSNGMFDANKGSTNFHTTLTENDVLRIRELYDTGNYIQKELAEMFDIARRTVSSIVTRTTWKHI